MTGQLSSGYQRRAILALGAVPFAVVILITHSIDETSDVLHQTLETFGWLAITVCIVGRTWCSLYIGGRKGATLVRNGPYSIVRNPLYLFSVIGAAGIGFAAGMIAMGVIFGTLSLLFFHAVSRHEERLLVSRFGRAGRAYLLEVPRWVPKFSLWADFDHLVISPRHVHTTFRDALLFALAIPALELLEWLQDGGIVPVLAHLP